MRRDLEFICNNRVVGLTGILRQHVKKQSASLVHCRTFFEFKDFVGGNKSEIHMETRSALMRNTQQQLYDVVADINSYKNYIPWCIDSEICSIIDLKASQKILLAKMIIGVGPLRETYTSTVELFPNSKVTSKIVGTDQCSFTELYVEWIFKPINGHGSPESRDTRGSDVILADADSEAPLTDVIFNVKYGFKSILLSRAFCIAAEKYNICDRILAAFKDRVNHREIYQNP